MAHWLRVSKNSVGAFALPITSMHSVKYAVYQDIVYWLYNYSRDVLHPKDDLEVTKKVSGQVWDRIALDEWYDIRLE